MNSSDDTSALPTFSNFCKGTVNHRSIGGRNSANSYRSYNARYAVFGTNACAVLVGINAWLSIGGANSMLSIGSINSMLSIGSLNSFLAIGCMNSFMKNCLSKSEDEAVKREMLEEDMVVVDGEVMEMDTFSTELN
mmetsp:Transcript_9598/g.15154  ORF Transcript_9598/g.15154 Transcript_9598/m.15154 type:complete len:136 (-) Transcript_9598:1155-1562(-)|eukprot:CAMPEP_0201606102 /NCGR_PEP_ID=MMETSP0492-20130828/5673_1 /ASSEMBLY_ACC=CAM_ASM_000837 /TAXON_ID=420259 /ORGANISM="Thalassiosira gravida, Strain GMp14c1" /LENGTH=135 /DNA_ID=CAMNT_0048070453 /DNA_START=278 /DNA_END=688 /DNA_ORIENTATION=-